MSLNMEGSALCEARLLHATAAGRQPLVDGLQFSMARRLQQDRLLSGPPANLQPLESGGAPAKRQLGDAISEAHLREAVMRVPKGTHSATDWCGCSRSPQLCRLSLSRTLSKQPNEHVGVLKSCRHLSEAELDTHPIGTSPRARQALPAALDR